MRRDGTNNVGGQTNGRSRTQSGQSVGVFRRAAEYSRFDSRKVSIQ